jgi:hypothetical protein
MNVKEERVGRRVDGTKGFARLCYVTFFYFPNRHVGRNEYKPNQIIIMRFALDTQNVPVH